jgi:hypothetical protein
MHARGPRTRLICSALLGALVISCGGPPVSVVAPAPRAAPEPETAPAQEEGGLARAPEPAQNSSRSQNGTQSQGGTRSGGTSSSGRAGGLPPGVGHELPTLDRDLDQLQDWKNSLDNDCTDAGLKAGCLHLDLKVYKSDRSTQIDNPGPDYGQGDNPKYSECKVFSINPASSQNGKIPAGSTITVKISCTPVGG